jgi:hypothetical protein
MNKGVDSPILMSGFIGLVDLAIKITPHEVIGKHFLFSQQTTLSL